MNSNSSTEISVAHESCLPPTTSPTPFESLSAKFPATRPPQGNHENPYPKYESEETAEKVKTIKGKQRTEILPEQWSACGYAYTNICEQKFRSFDSRSLPIDVVDASQVSMSFFFKTYARNYRPCLIRNAINHWPCVQNPDKWGIYTGRFLSEPRFLLI